MRRTRLNENPCSIAKALDVVGDPWTLLILRDALLGVSRFEQFSQRLGIPRATLTARLEHLCDRRVLDKASYQDAPPRYEYVLTEKGAALSPVVLMLMQWGDRWERDDLPPTRLVDTETGRLIDPVLVDRETGVPLVDLDVRVEGAIARGTPRHDPTN